MSRDPLVMVHDLNCVFALVNDKDRTSEYCPGENRRDPRTSLVLTLNQTLTDKHILGHLFLQNDCQGIQEDVGDSSSVPSVVQRRRVEGQDEGRMTRKKQPKSGRSTLNHQLNYPIPVPDTGRLDSVL